ncbi:MAG: IS3 family transposase [Bacteroidales bacterium]|nr:IS3 family transposase [Bacteroidales bacterium]
MPNVFKYSFEADLKQYFHYYNYDRIKNRLKMSPVDYRIKTKSNY